jgi:hypothetical protein
VGRLTVDLNDDGLHTIAAPSSFDADGPFEIWFHNHGEAVHVHCSLDDSLSSVARLAESNHYVERGATYPVVVDAQPAGDPVAGELTIATGYGATTTRTTVTIGEEREERPSVDTDERLSKPKQPEPEPPSLLERLAAINVFYPFGISLWLILFGLLTILFAAYVAMQIEGPFVVAGAVLVAVGVLVALVLSRGE